MNSHIVEKTMHSIKNIDRLTDLAAIDVYNTTHDTINKYEIMKEHATEEYTNESFYQESVLAGVLIGAGVLGVAISAFFIIKKIIDSKDSADSSVKSADGKMVAAQVDLSDPKSTEKYLADLKARLEKLTETKSIKVTKSINKDEFAAAEKKINTWSEQLQEMIDNKHEAAEIEKIIDGMDISSVDVSKIFVNNEVDASVADFVEALGLRSISSFAGLLTSLKKKIDDVEKMVNNKKDKEAENAVQISQDHLTKLKNQNNDAAKLIAALKSQSKETLSETDKAVLGAINAETEAKKKDEEDKPTVGTGSDTPQNANPQAQSGETAAPVAQNSEQNVPPSSTPKNLNFQASGFKGGQSAEPTPVANPQAAATGNETPTPVSGNQPVEPNLGANFLNAVNGQRQQQLNENINRQLDDKEAENKQNWIDAANANNAAAEAEEQPKQISPEYQQINDEMMKDLLKTNPFTSDSEEPKKDEKTDSKITYKPLGVPNEYGASLIVSVTDKSAENVVRPYLEYVKTNKPSDTTESVTIDINNNDDVKKFNERLNLLLGMEKDLMDNLEVYAPAGKIKPETVQTYLELLNVLRTEMIDKFTDWNVSNDVINNAKKSIEKVNKRYESFIKIINAKTTDTSGEKKPEDQVKTEPENPPTSENSSEESKQSENTDDRQLIDELKAKIKQTPDYLDKFKRNPDDVPDNFDWWTQYVADGPYNGDQYDRCLAIAYNELLKENPTDNPPTPKDQNTDENSQETTTGTSTEEPETKPEGENSPAAEETENSGEKKWSVSKIIELAKSGSDKVFESLSAINNDAIENDVVPKKIFETGLMDAAAVMALPMDYKTRLLATFESNNSLLGTVKSIINEIKNGDRSAVNKLKNINVNDELTTGNDVSDFITSIIPRVKSAFDSIIAKYNTPEMKEKRAQDISNIEQNVAAFFNKIKETCAGLFNKDKALAKVNELETVVEGKIHHLDPKYSGKREGLPNYGSNGKGINIGGHTSNGQTSGLIDGVPENEINRQQRQLESLSNNKIQAPAQFNPSAPADWNDRMEALGKTGIPNKQVPEPKTAPTPLNPAAPTEWNDNMNALKSAGAENISQKTEVPPIAPIDTDADIAKAKEEKAQLDALQQHRQEQLAQFKAERAQRKQQVRDAYAQDAQARQNAMNEELAKQSQEDEQKKAQAEELTKANEDANVAEAIRQAEEEKKALEQGKNLSVSPQSTESLDNAAKLIAMQDFIKNFKDPAWREAHPGVVSWQELYNSEDYKNEAIMKAEAERMKNEKLAENRAGIQFIKEQNYEAIVPSLNKVLKTTPDDKTITRYLDGLKTAYAKILMQYQQNPGNARKIIEDYSKNGAAPYEFYTVPYNELRQTQLIDWQQRLFNEKVELDKDRKRNRKKIKAVDKIIDKLIELDELLKTSVHNVIAAATKNPMRALEAALVMFQESDEEIIAGLTAIENFINKADEVKASEEEADNTPENPAEEPSDEEVSQSILSILKS